MNERNRLFYTLSEAISNAANHPRDWPIFLELLGHALGSDHVVLHREVFNGSRRSRVNFHWGVSTEGLESYEAYYGPRNPVFVHGRGVLVPGRPGLRSEACSDRTFFGSEYYNDFARKLDIQDTLGVVLIQETDSAVMLAIHGSHSRERFGDADLELVRELTPHLQTATRLQSRLDLFEARAMHMQAAIDACVDPVLIVSPNAEVLGDNVAARHVFASLDGISLVGGRMQLRDRVLQRRLELLLRDALLAHRGGLKPVGGALRVPRPSGAPDWLIQVIGRDRSNVAVIFIVTCGTEDAPSESDLKELFDLSPMQRRIAIRLFQGTEPNDIADDLKISKNTIKTHIRRLFSKLGVSRQTELMRLLARLRGRSHNL